VAFVLGNMAAQTGGEVAGDIDIDIAKEVS
jgi:hypothetical protein